MNSRQAINLLKGLEQSLDDYCELNDEGKAAFRMAIESLELFGNAEQLPSAQPYTDEEIQKMQDIEQAQLDKAYEMGKADALRWIPCSERFPEESGTYTVTAYDGATKRVTYAKYQKRLKRWELTGARAYWRVLAWCPPPEPYKEK